VARGVAARRVWNARRLRAAVLGAARIPRRRRRAREDGVAAASTRVEAHLAVLVARARPEARACGRRADPAAVRDRIADRARAAARIRRTSCRSLARARGVGRAGAERHALAAAGPAPEQAAVGVALAGRGRRRRGLSRLGRRIACARPLRIPGPRRRRVSCTRRASDEDERDEEAHARGVPRREPDGQPRTRRSAKKKWSPSPRSRAMPPRPSRRSSPSGFTSS
jgi:hypothetical protein